MATAAFFDANSASSSAAPMASGNASGSTASNSGASGITANDFLTLLVMEMKNQDPTANTDPNEYINQLVQVNSLQQLISINEVLTGALGDTSTKPGSTPSAKARIAVEPIDRPVHSESPINPAVTARIEGNLGIPVANPSSERLANALNGSDPARVAKPR